MDVATEQLEKARIWAYWGFAGIFNPVIGIIAATISLSILDRLDINESDEDVATEHSRLLTVANNAKILSIIILIAMTVAASAAFVTSMNAFSDSVESTKSVNDALEDYDKNY
tara:strand:- start:272 stop:610 length:339 start_codon:yes stop_codon:yes gene_type:complete